MTWLRATRVPQLEVITSMKAASNDNHARRFRWLT
jgi:hypothetical protein